MGDAVSPLLAANDGPAATTSTARPAATAAPRRLRTRVTSIPPPENPALTVRAGGTGSQEPRGGRRGPASVVLLGEVDALVDLVAVAELVACGVAGLLQALVDLVVVLVLEVLEVVHVRHEDSFGV